MFLDIAKSPQDIIIIDAFLGLLLAVVAREHSEYDVVVEILRFALPSQLNLSCPFSRQR
jgi:hypothetical protein